MRVAYSKGSRYRPFATPRQPLPPNRHTIFYATFLGNLRIFRQNSKPDCSYSGSSGPFRKRTHEAAGKTDVALRLDLLIVDEFRDAGVSGSKDLDNRPGLTAPFDRVESNGVTIVLVENEMRLARDLMVGEVILQQLTSAGCKVIATDSATDLSADSDDPTPRLIRQVLGAGLRQRKKSSLTRRTGHSSAPRASRDYQALPSTRRTVNSLFCG